MLFTRHCAFFAFSLTLVFQAASQTPSSNSNGLQAVQEAEDIYRAESATLDAKVSYRFDENWSIYLTGKNLTDEPDLTYRNGNERFIAENPGYENYGSEYRIGFTWRN
jgi:outer membrane receptor protein involved in Fe transport